MNWPTSSISCCQKSLVSYFYAYGITQLLAPCIYHLHCRHEAILSSQAKQMMILSSVTLSWTTRAPPVNNTSSLMPFSNQFTDLPLWHSKLLAAWFCVTLPWQYTNICHLKSSDILLLIFTMYWAKTFGVVIQKDMDKLTECAAQALPLKSTGF